MDGWMDGWTLRSKNHNQKHRQKPGGPPPKRAKGRAFALSVEQLPSEKQRRAPPGALAQPHDEGRKKRRARAGEGEKLTKSESERAHGRELLPRVCRSAFPPPLSWAGMAGTPMFVFGSR